MSDHLFHITTTRDADAACARGVYEPAGFGREGFVHCSYAHQVLATATRLFSGRPDLVLLEIDPARLTCRVVAENLEGGAELYPHVYGVIPFTAVSAVHPFPLRPDGTFSLPASAGLV